jgi:hypothetical protein
MTEQEKEAQQAKLSKSEKRRQEERILPTNRARRSGIWNMMNDVQDEVSCLRWCRTRTSNADSRLQAQDPVYIRSWAHIRRLSSRGKDEQEPGEETNPGIPLSWDNNHIMATSRINLKALKLNSTSWGKLISQLRGGQEGGQWALIWCCVVNSRLEISTNSKQKENNSILETRQLGAKDS